MEFRKAPLLAIAPVLAAALAAAADPDPLSIDHFVKVTEAGGKDVVAVRLAPAAGTDPGFVAWLDADGALKVGPASSIALAPGAQAAETTLASKKIGAGLFVKWGSNQIQSGIFKTNRATKVAFVDGRDELEIHLVLLAPEGTEKTLRGALCFRVLRGEKVVDSGSIAFTAPEGKRTAVSVPTKGASLSVQVEIPAEG